MADFSIDMASERIVDARTKRYFKEVSGCYAAGHYRSAVVMLWSVIVCDVLFKLDQVANAYGDATAKAILTEIADVRRTNPKSPEWEAELIDKVAGRTDLIDAVELTHLRSIQEHRHLSAHPVLTAAEALFSPNKETARAHIRNALEAVLTKPAIMSKKVFDAFVEDVEEVSRLRPSRDGLKRFLEGKYFPHFSLATHRAVFRSLWRLVFKSTDPRCEANREINAVALSILLERHKPDIERMISEEREWFSDVSFGNSHLARMVAFFGEYPSVFTLLTDATKAPLHDYANLSLDHFTLCWFLSDSMEAHFNEVLRLVRDERQVMSGATFGEFCQSLKHTDMYGGALDIGISLYGQSGNYDTADLRFAAMIRPFITDFTTDHVIAFLRAVEGNGQTWGRGRASGDHREIRRHCDERFPGAITFDDYPCFRTSIGA